MASVNAHTGTMTLNLVKMMMMMMQMLVVDSNRDNSDAKCHSKESSTAADIAGGDAVVAVP